MFCILSILSLDYALVQVARMVQALGSKCPDREFFAGLVDADELNVVASSPCREH